MQKRRVSPLDLEALGASLPAEKTSVVLAGGDGEIFAGWAGDGLRDIGHEASTRLVNAIIGVAVRGRGPVSSGV